MAQLSQEQPVHFIGIGGVGMSPLAELLLDLGVPVSGSDAKASPTLDKLKKAGAKVSIGQAAENVPSGSIVVYSSAIDEENPERQQAKTLSLTQWHRSELLHAVLEGSLPGFDKTVGLSGTHGKTTLTGMMGWLLEQLNQDPVPLP